MTRTELTEQIVTAKLNTGLTWAELAKAVSMSEVWTTAALLGQHPMTKKQAEVVAEKLSLSEEAVNLLQVRPYRGTISQTPPTDSVVYRLHEIVLVYGTTIKKLIHEKFGDGIMSAIDFDMTIEKQPDPNGTNLRKR